MLLHTEGVTHTFNSCSLKLIPSFEWVKQRLLHQIFVSQLCTCYQLYGEVWSASCSGQQPQQWILPHHQQEGTDLYQDIFSRWMFFGELFCLLPPLSLHKRGLLSTCSPFLVLSLVLFNTLCLSHHDFPLSAHQGFRAAGFETERFWWLALTSLFSSLTSYSSSLLMRAIKGFSGLNFIWSTDHNPFWS